MTHRLILACGLTLGLLNSLTLAGEHADQVVTATRTLTDQHSTGSSISVISRADIEKSKKTSLPDLLRSIPGLEIVQAAPGANASAFMRGAGSGQTLFLVDGMRINSPSSGGFDFSDLALDSIERIEILRGPQSTLYGSDAMGGVINIITRAGSDDHRHWAKIQGGSLGHAGASASVQGKKGNVQLGVTASWEQWDGFSVASEKAGNTEDDKYENMNLSLQANSPFLNDGSLAINLRALQSKKELDGFELGVGPVDDLNYQSERDAIHAGIIARKPLTETIDQSIHLGLFDETLEGTDPDTAFNNFEIKSRVIDLVLQSDIALGDSQLLSIGYEYQNLETENVGNFDEDVDLHAVFIQHQTAPGENVSLSVGIRGNDHSEFGDKTTAKAALSWSCPSLPTRLHSSVGSGFRAPTLNDLYFPDFGNRDLSPETSVGYDIGIEHRANDRLLIDLTWFSTEYDDLISFDDSTFSAINVDEADISGIEVVLSVQATEACSLDITHTYTDTEDKATGEQLARRPENRTVVTGRYSGDLPFDAHVSVVTVNGRIDSNSEDMDDYTRVDVALTYTALDTIKPFIRIDNVFDEDYEEVTGFTTPGVAAVGGVRVQW